MPEGILIAALSIVVPTIAIGIQVWLRRYQQRSMVVVIGQPVFHGDRTACAAAVDALADAGVVAWIEEDPDGDDNACAVHVDADQVDDIPALFELRHRSADGELSASGAPDDRDAGTRIPDAPRPKW